MNIKSATAILFGAALAFGCGEDKAEIKAPVATAEAADEIRIVGSSTVYPFSTKVAQEFKNKTGHSVVVESTGSGGGHKLFCEGAGGDTPDVTNSSRRQKKSEFEKCVANGADEVVEVKIGFDGIVLANAIDGAAVDLTLKQVFQAFAKQVPMSDDDCTLRDNPYAKWSDIDASLPDATIEAYGPPPTSGTRDAFVEIAMEGGAKKFACLAALKDEDSGKFKKVSHTLREDGKWIDAGENDNAIVQTLTNTPTAIGVFGYSFLDQNADMVKGALIGAVEPTFENIAGGAYPISRSLFFYLKAGNVDVTDGLKDYALEFTSEEAWGPGGYLEEIGLVPLPDEERAKYRKAVETLTGYSQ
ncbi:MAG: phosphate ABC transporter substrate-binding protein [Marinicaulis sp.]|nr:phosphate ABC transporter substrate-binding protein [Marinicaulis sp.]NNL87470.1 phosphate ABC transporter substrate-binding protein [Marinicaulis sp.]